MLQMNAELIINWQYFKGTDMHKTFLTHSWTGQPSSHSLKPGTPKACLLAMPLGPSMPNKHKGNPK